MKKLPITAASDVGKKYSLDRVLLIASDYESGLTHTVSWGKDKTDCGMAAMDIQKLRAVLEAQPTSLEDAVEAAKRVRPKNIEGTEYKCAYDEEGRTICLEIARLETSLNTQRKLIDDLLKLIAELDPGWNSITTPDIVVEAAAFVAGIKT